VVGGYLGALALVKARVWAIRLLLIGVMAFTAFSLGADGLAKLGVAGRLPGPVALAVFAACMAAVAVAVARGRAARGADGGGHGRGP